VTRTFRVRGDSGSAVVDFVLVGVLLIVLVLAVMQVAFALHVRNTVAAAAAEGARYAANADRGIEDGVLRTRSVVSEAVGSRYATDVIGGIEYIGESQTVVIEVTAPLPVLGPFGPSRTMTVRGHALVESAP
jgi:Flp pilus assembly protein TadG